MYFSLFPTILYQFKGDAFATIVTDITKRVKVRDQILTTAELYDLYTVKDGETPDVLASKYYGNSDYHWILMLTNTIINPNFDWPMDVPVLNIYVSNKYGPSNIYNTHHYELVSPLPYRNGMTMPHDASFSDYGADLYNSDTESIIPMTNYDVETRLNDNNRQISIFKAALVPQFITEFTNLITQ